MQNNIEHITNTLDIDINYTNSSDNNVLEIDNLNIEIITDTTDNTCVSCTNCKNKSCTGCVDTNLVNGINQSY